MSHGTYIEDLRNQHVARLERENHSLKLAYDRSLEKTAELSLLCEKVISALERGKYETTAKMFRRSLERIHEAHR